MMKIRNSPTAAEIEKRNRFADAIIAGDQAAYDRLRDGTIYTPSAPKGQKAAAWEAPKVYEKPKESCHGSGYELDRNSLMGLEHAICHRMSGRCVSIHHDSYLPVMGRSTREDGRWRIAIYDLATTESMAKTFFHELAHIVLVDQYGDTGEDSAKALAATWEKNAKDNVYKVRVRDDDDPGFLLLKSFYNLQGKKS